VHLTTVLEDMPVQETSDGIRELHANDLPVGAVIVNMVRANELDEEARRLALGDALPRDQVEKDLDRIGVDATPEIVDGLLTEARDHAERRELEDEQRERIAALGVPTYELPRLSDGIDLGGLYELAADLCEQGLA
jgi:hypothetical protein